MEPCFLELDSKQETYFIENFLEKSDLVEFWFKNGVNSEIFFGIPYQNEVWETKTFYPDFIVYFTNGMIGVFDPKSGFTLAEGKNKAKWLEKFLKENWKLGRKIIGGLIECIHQENATDFTFRVNTKGEYDLETREDFALFNDDFVNHLW